MKWGKMKLDYNKVISQVSQDFDLTDEEDLKEFTKKKEEKRSKEKRTLGRPEWVYYLWYLHLKLCLEMEEKKIPLQRRRKYRRGVQVQRKVSHIHRLKINRKVYEGIDWEDLKTLSWRKWKEKYLDLFMSGQTKEVEHGDHLKCEPQFLYLEVDLRNTETVTINQIKKILKNQNRKNLPSSKGILGKPNYHSSILGYNFIVGMIQGDDWEKVMKDNSGRVKSLTKENYEEFEMFLGEFMKGDYSFRDEFDGFCYLNFHRYILDTQKVLYNVSQGRFFDKTPIPKNKWKDKWSQKTFTW